MTSIKSSRFRPLTVWTAAALLGAIVAGSPCAAAEPVKFKISAGEAAQALNAFSEQTGLQMFFEHSAVEGHKTRSVSGEFEPAAALEMLLRDSGLTFEFVNARTVAIRSEKSKARTAADAFAAPEEGAPALKLAQSSPSTAGQDGSGSIQKSDEAAKGVPEILVKGSRTLNTDIERTEDSPQPYVVFGKDEIERSRSTNLEEFLKSRLPMNTVSGTNNQGGSAVPRSTVNLRGLGPNQTLILVDGRRLPNVSGIGRFEQADINGIPLAAIERVEVLPSTASGIYGGGATGGVINIILRRDYNGMDLKATYGNTFDSDVASRAIDWSGGFNLEGGKTQVMLAGSYSDSNTLRSGERDFATRAQKRLMENNPDAYYGGASPPLGYTTNICNATPGMFGASCNNTPLVLKNGTVLSSSRTYVPVGYAGYGSDNGQGLVNNAGRYTLELAQDAIGGERSLLSVPQMRSALLNLRRSMSSRLDAFVDLSYLESKGTAGLGNVPSSVGITLADTAPNNPFTTTINVRAPSVGLLMPISSRSETVRAAGGAVLRLGADWSAAADYVWSRSNAKDTSTNPAVSFDADTALADGTLNVMRDVNVYRLDWSPYLLPSPNFINGPARNVLKDATLRVSGPLWRLPAGPLTLVSSVERREEVAEDAFQRFLGFGFIILAPERSQNVTSYYLETRAPLIAAAQSVPGVRELELQASVRRDEYKTTSSDPSYLFPPTTEGPFDSYTRVSNEVAATKHTLALRYAPVEGVALRASVGTGFLPPSIDQIVGSFFPNGTIIAGDPKRDDVPGLITGVDSISGGNPNLRPEESKSTSVGVIVTPRSLPGLRLSLDYTRIRKTGEIASLTPQDLLYVEDLFPGRITRDPLTPADANLGYTGGVITAMDTSLVNATATEVKSYDLQLDYRWSTGGFGDWHFYTVATRQQSFERQPSPAAGAVNSVGYSNGPLEWRGNLGLVWEHGPLSLAWNTQYFDSYFVYGSTASPGTIAAARLNQGAAKIPSQNYSDLVATWRFAGTGLLRGFAQDSEVSLGIQNLFDQSPPIIAMADPYDGYSFYGDPRLRRYSISIRTHF